MAETKMATICCDSCIHKALCKHAEDMQKVWTAVPEANVYGRRNNGGSEQYTSKRVTLYDFVETITVACKYYHSCETLTTYPKQGLDWTRTMPYEITCTNSSTEGTIYG